MGESTGWKHESIASVMGRWAWLIVLLNGIAEVLFWLFRPIAGLIAIIQWNTAYPMYRLPMFRPVWWFIWGVFLIILAVAIIKPKFSDKCAAKDWDALYNWVLNLGKLRLPWMLIWGIIITIFGLWGWGGILIIVPACLLLFAGPKKYDWKSE